MKKIYIILIVMALLAATYLPALMPGVDAANTDQPAAAESSHFQGNTDYPDRAAVSPSPVVEVAIGLFTLLFGALTFLPLLRTSPNPLSQMK